MWNVKLEVRQSEIILGLAKRSNDTYGMVIWTDHIDQNISKSKILSQCEPFFGVIEFVQIGLHTFTVLPKIRPSEPTLVIQISLLPIWVNNLQSYLTPIPGLLFSTCNGGAISPFMISRAFYHIKVTTNYPICIWKWRSKPLFKNHFNLWRN